MSFPPRHVLGASSASQSLALSFADSEPRGGAWQRAAAGTEALPHAAAHQLHSLHAPSLASALAERQLPPQSAARRDELAACKTAFCVHQIEVCQQFESYVHQFYTPLRTEALVDVAEGAQAGGGAPGARNGTLSSVEADASLREGNGSACRHSTRTSTERLQADKKTAPNSDAGSRRQSDGASSAAQSPALQPGPIVDGISKRHAALRLLASARHCQDQAARCKNDTDGGTEPLRALPSQPSPV